MKYQLYILIIINFKNFTEEHKRAQLNILAHEVLRKEVIRVA